MKAKKTISMFIVAVFVLSSMAVVGMGQWTPPSPATWVYVEDYVFFTDANLTDTYFNVSINVYNATGVGAWEYRLYYNSSLIEAVYVYDTPTTSICTDWVPIDGGAYSPDAPPTINNTFSADLGRVWTGALFPTGQEFTGSATFSEIKFRIKYAPPQTIGGGNATVSSTLDLDNVNTKLKDALGDPITISIDDGYYEYTRPEITPNAPTASFTYSPPTVYTGVLVTFIDQSNDGGFPPLTYAWDLDGDGAYDDSFVANPTYTYTTAGTYQVKLNVTNNIGLSHDTTKPLVVSLPPAALLDVFTIKSWLGNSTLYRERGKLIGAEGSAFTGGETVTLRSQLTFTIPAGTFPVFGVVVSFQTDLPDGTPYTSQADVTNPFGNATVDFSLSVTPANGTYSVTSTAIFQGTLSDTLNFEVGWIIDITDVTVLTDPVAQGGTASFSVSVVSIDPWDQYPVLITISVKDSQGTALGTDSTSDWVIGTGSSPYTLTLLIPNIPNAWPGLAEVEVNVYTGNLPSDTPAGTAYCPPATEYFDIIP